MISDVTIGQYFPAPSVIHGLDPRTKLIGLIGMIVAIFVANSVYSLLVVTAIIMTVLLISKVPLRLYFSTIKTIWVFIAFTSVLNILYGSGTVLFKFGFITITELGIERAIVTSVRILLLIIVSSALTFTTSPTDLTYAIEKLLKPLSLLGLGGAVHALAMMMTISLRFIPTLIEETDKISSAQKARGADTTEGSIINRVKSLIPILIPLLISSFRRAAELADAMECSVLHRCRGAHTNERTSLKNE